MRKITFSYGLSLALGLLLMPTAHAEGTVSNTDSGYRIPLYDNIEFKAEASGDNRVSMSWTAFKGYNDEQFEYYKVIRSYSNPNPVYPEDGAIGVKQSVGDLRHVDEKADRSAYYRVCAITDVKGRHCSNVLWVEIEKTDRPSTECKNFAHNGECEDAVIAKEQKEKEQEAWKEKQDAAKKRLEEKKAKQAEEKEVRQKEWEAKKEAQKKEAEAKKSEKKTAHDEKKAEIYEKMYARLDVWLENFAKRLDEASMSNSDKIEKIEAVQKKFYEWEKGNELRMKMVDHIDEGLNELKQKYSAGDDFAEIDDFLNGLLED